MNTFVFFAEEHFTLLPPEVDSGPWDAFFLQKHSKALSCTPQPEKAPTWLFGRILNAPQLVGSTLLWLTQRV